MINKPTVSELLKKSENRYELVIATAKRARQIEEGRAKLIETNEENPVTIAVNEINEGKVRIVKENELSKNSDQILREQEEEELRRLQEEIYAQLEESKKLEELIKYRHSQDQGQEIDYSSIIKQTSINEDELLELMNGAGVLSDQERLDNFIEEKSQEENNNEGQE